MGKIGEDTLSNWVKPPSDTEETKLSNSKRMVKDALDSNETTKIISFEVFGQGSYANDTNVRLNSDIDINVRYTGGFYFDLPKDMTQEDIGIADFPGASLTFSEYKNNIEQALVEKFGRESVIRKNKCITILENSYRVETDVVPTWNYRRYLKDRNFILGTKIISDTSGSIVNFPLQHIENGKTKNSNTSRRFKRLTRILKKLRYKMIDDGEPISENITSFLLECLVWNVPNNIFNDYNNWSDRLKYSIIELYSKTKEDSTCEKWGEVSELFYLFHPGRKWSRENVNDFLVQVWNYLELE